MEDKALELTAPEYTRGRAITWAVAVTGLALAVAGAALCFRWLDDVVIILAMAIVAKSLLSGDLWARWAYPLGLAAQALLKLLYLRQEGGPTALAWVYIACTLAIAVAAFVLLMRSASVRAFMSVARERGKREEQRLLDKDE